MSKLIRRLTFNIVRGSLLAACIFAVMISCGLPAALHRLGHDLTHTGCEASERLTSSPTSSGPSVGADEKLSDCWLQNLVASINQYSPDLTRSSSPALATLKSKLRIHTEQYVELYHPREWSSPRGPPIA